jgi:hypothetical protein
MLAEPVSQLQYPWLLGGDMQGERFERLVGRGDLVTVDPKKEGGSSNAGSLISVHERVVSDDAVHEHRRFHHEVCVELCGSKSRSWTTERRLQEGQITDSVLTAGFFDDTIMDKRTCSAVR